MDFPTRLFFIVRHTERFQNIHSNKLRSPLSTYASKMRCEFSESQLRRSCVHNFVKHLFTVECKHRVKFQM